MKHILLVALVTAAGPVAALDIVTRSDWGARLPLFEMDAQHPVRITIHHTATPQRPSKSVETKLRALQAFSQSNAKLADGRTKEAWADVPYHYYIDVSGRVAEGRQVSSVGDTNTNYDPTGHIAVVVEGNFEIEQPSAAQRQALIELLQSLSDQHDIPMTGVGHHSNFASTLCPGTNLARELPGIVAAVK